MTYSQKLRDPRWLAMREQVLAWDRRRCVNSPDHPMPLEVHHRSYGAGREPWEYPLDNFVTLCRDCHIAEHRLRLTNPRPRRVRGGFYGWHQVETVVGHEYHGYLTELGRRIVCGCFRVDLNPDAPDIVLPGTRQDWVRKARLFERQGRPIPVFIEGEGLPWEYLGLYRVEAITCNTVEIAIHQERSGRKDIGLVMFLRQG